jgi:hypothetical protein
MTRIQEIYQEMMTLNKEIKERNARIDKLMEEALDIAMKDAQGKPEPVNHVSNAESGSMRVSTHPLAGSLPPNIIKR